MIEPYEPQAQTVFSTRLGSGSVFDGGVSTNAHFYQPACGNSEGWGPLSPTRYDFTPCFLDVWVAVVAGSGIFFGLGAIWYLLRRCTAQPVKKNWHFWAKMVRRRTIYCV